MGFMKLEITGKQRWAMVKGPCGTEYVPIDELGITLPECLDTMEGKAEAMERLDDYIAGWGAWKIEIVEGYGARLSAPGYLDCTNWVVFETEQEAWDSLEENFEEEEEED